MGLEWKKSNSAGKPLSFLYDTTVATKLYGPKGGGVAVAYVEFFSFGPQIGWRYVTVGAQKQGFETEDQAKAMCIISLAGI
jgi:hypothetical protein